MSTDTTPVAKFDALVAALTAQGLTMGAISKLLGYAGTNGARDVATVRSGRSTKHASVDAACDVLRAALPSATADPTAAAPAKPAAPPAAPAKPAGGAGKPSTPDDSGATAKKVPAATEPPLEERFDGLVAAAVARGETHNSLSALLGYAGKNGKRDLDKVRGGKSKTVALAQAVAVLADAGGEAPAAPSAATGDDGGAASADSGAPTKGAPATKDAAPSVPAPLPKVWGGDASSAASPAPSKAQAAAPPPPASTASAAAADPVARFDAAVAVRKGRGEKEGCISALLGYSGKNGKRDLDAVRSGKSTKHTVPSACAVLEAA